MIQVIDIGKGTRLNDYASFAYLSNPVQELRAQAKVWVPKLHGRTVWMVNSTALGGGVAEMLPKMVDILRELGVRTEWVVVSPDAKEFFPLTKRIHNSIHDFGHPGFSADDGCVYNRVSRQMADEMQTLIAPEDILVIHDPQPLGAGSELKQRLGMKAIWRCHIGLDRHTLVTDAAWNFLKPYTKNYDHTVFSAQEYVPSFLMEKASIITPAIDPLSDKNRDLLGPELMNILCKSGLHKNGLHPFLASRWKRQVKRLQPDGSFANANKNNEIGLLFHPVVTQVSRWDRLKGWETLLEAFVRFKRSCKHNGKKKSSHYRRANAVQLLLAGPEPAAVQDDPEGKGVLDELCTFYRKLAPEDQKSVVLLTLPMSSRTQNHLMVNAIQRCSSLVVQNSLQEGFGLTATEAMWKKIPVLGTFSCGLRQQIRDGIDGRLTANPKDPKEIAENLDYMLTSSAKLEKWGRQAQHRVYNQFLIFSQVQKWLQCLSAVSNGSG
ncbi:MAG: glycosyltransferase [Desulfobacterales bacterium]|nr:MAG: glycosyltransferase [Desulfobacterales bacterium]